MYIVNIEFTKTKNFSNVALATCILYLFTELVPIVVQFKFI